MAKKQTKKAEVAPEIEATNEMQQVVIERPKTPEWEIKDRYYYLTKDQSPLSYQIQSKNILWFDEEKGFEREITLTSNQKSLFVDEFKGQERLERIVFRDGVLSVPKNKQNMQKLLSLYHPAKGSVYLERDEVKDAENEVNWIEVELQAMNLASQMDIDQAEAILRVERGSSVSKMTSKELKRDLLVMARKNPFMFLELANDDNVHLRNVGVKATESGIIKLSPDNRHFYWASNDRKLMTIPFDEHPYSALAAWFKTDEGMEVFNSIEKRLK